MITKLNKFDIILKSGTITTYIDTEEKKNEKEKTGETIAKNIRKNIIRKTTL